MSFKLEKTLTNLLKSGEIQVNLQGHFKAPEGTYPVTSLSGRFQKYIIDKIISFDLRFGEGNFEWDEVTPIQEFLEGKTLSTKSYDFEDCSICGEEVGFEFKDGIVQAMSTCKYPGGMPEYSFTIAVPSGKLAFANDMRDLVRTDADYYVNLQSEIRLCEEDYGRKGMIHIFVGNSCPGIYQTSSKSLFVGNEGFAVDGEVWDGEKYVPATPEQIEKASFPKDAIKRGSVCTDLWWVSAMDYTLLKQRCEETDQDLDDYEKYLEAVVEIRPGIYTVTSRYHIARENENEAQAYFKIEWLREWTETDAYPKWSPDPSASATKLEDSHLIKKWHVSRKKYSSIFPTITSYLDHCFCVLGSGKHWDGGVISHEEKDTPWLPKGALTPIKGTDFEKRIWTWAPDQFLKKEPPSKLDKQLEALDSVLPDNFLDDVLDNPSKVESPKVKNHLTVYPLSKGSGIYEMPLHVNDYYLAVAISFFKTVSDNGLQFCDSPQTEGERTLQAIRDGLDFLYSLMLEANLQDRILEIYEEFRKNPKLLLE